jgi:hypothetical protein
MPNRFALGDQRFLGGDDGGDWWGQNDPAVVTRPPNAGIPSEQGGIAGNIARAEHTGIAGAQGVAQQAASSSPASTDPMNRDYIRSQLTTLYQGLGKSPTGRGTGPTDIDYYIDKIIETGGWTPQNAGYWQNRIPQDVRGQTPSLGAGGGGGGYSGPGAIPPPFQAPSFEELQKEPGYQARYQMGLQGLERGAAAHGSLLSGGTQKALARYGQDYASNEYGNAYNRALSTYNTNWQTQSLDPWRRYADLYGGGLQAALGTKTSTPIFAS